MEHQMILKDSRLTCLTPQQSVLNGKDREESKDHLSRLIPSSITLSVVSESFS